MKTSLRDERRSMVSQTIERAALDLFSRRGFAEVSVDDVAAAAGISSRTFFRYFTSKSDVLLGYRRRLDARLLSALRDRPQSEGPITALRRAYEATSAIAESDRDVVLRRARAVAAAPALLTRSRGEQLAGVDAIAAELGARMNAQSDEPGPRVAAAAMSAVANVEWEAWVASDGRGNPAELITDALELLQRGLAVLDDPSTGASDDRFV